MGEWRQLVASVLMCEPETLPPDSTSLRDIQGWDSLKHVLLVVALEKQLNTQLSAEQIQAITTLGDVAGVLKQREVDG